MHMTTNGFAGKRVVVMGLGRFGGGIGAARWLAEQGAKVTVTDTATEAKLADSVAQLADLPIKYRLGGHDMADLDGCDLLVVSPAVPKDKSEFVAAARALGIPLSSEMNLFVERCPARRIIGVTGAAGKSTTTAMIGGVLKEAFASHAWMGGNIGQSLLAELDYMGPEDAVVLELSSFQLEDLGRLKWSPPIAVVTNIQPNHLDRHGTLEAYADAKLNLVRFQKPDGVVIIPPGDEPLQQRLISAGAGPRLRVCEFDAKFAPHVKVPGGHNRQNAAVAIAVGRALGIADDVIARGLAGFKGLPHRLELVGEHNGVRYFNDSKATTPESARIALDAFTEPVIMLVGGKDKGAPFDELSKAMAARAKAVISYGEQRATFYEQVMRYAAGLSRRATASQVEKLDEAVIVASRLAVPGDVVVLSPACTSYDQFGNYEQRGACFRDAVRKLGSA